MTNNNIRVIKRGERAAENRTRESHVRAGDNLRDTTREVTSHVTAWIKEFQQARRSDARRSFASLFADAAPQAR